MTCHLKSAIFGHLRSAEKAVNTKLTCYPLVKVQDLEVSRVCLQIATDCTSLISPSPTVAYKNAKSAKLPLYSQFLVLEL